MVGVDVMGSEHGRSDLGTATGTEGADQEALVVVGRDLLHVAVMHALFVAAVIAASFLHADEGSPIRPDMPPTGSLVRGVLVRGPDRHRPLLAGPGRRAWHRTRGRPARLGPRQR